MLRWLVAPISLTLASLVSQGQAHTFVRQQAGSFVGGGVEFHRTKTFWTTGAKRDHDDDNYFDRNTFWLYAEHDVSERDTPIAFLKLIDLENYSGAATGIDEIELGWRRALYLEQDNPHEVAVEFRVLIPGGGVDHPGFRLGRWGGELDAVYRLGMDLGSFPWHNVVLLGFRWYTDYPSDQLRAEWRQALDVTAWLQLQTLCELHYGLANGSRRSVRGVEMISQFRVLRVAGLARIRLNRNLSLVVDYFNHPWAANYWGGGGWSAAFWSEF